ncbi:MAG TPA: hypothetical protein VKU19_07820 [Bryobacteraceae bacterium]|nr:hypothetical protein [Bryobacteraceae bacterium]
MANAAKSVRQRLRDYLAVEQPAAVTEAVWRDLVERLGPVSESYLRELIGAAGVPIEQPYAGVDQHTLEGLEGSLRALLQVYLEAMAAGNRERARYCRRQVIGAKDRAKFLVQNPRTAPERKVLKEEMVQWMLVWLENPEVFPAWVETRKSVLDIGKQAAS